MFRFVFGQPRFLLALLAAYWSAMIVGTHIPEPHIPQIVDMQDKLVHGAAYGFLTLLVLLLWRSTSTAVNPISYVVLGVGMAVHAAADELTQHFVAGRSPDLLDWTADMLGVSLAVLFTEAMFRRFGARPWFATSATSADAAS